MKHLHFYPSAVAPAYMTMAIHLNPGIDLQAACQAVESMGCRLEISLQERSSIMACRTAVTSDERFHSLAEAEGWVHGVAPAQAHFHEVGVLDRS